MSSPAISRMRLFIRALRVCHAAAAEAVEFDGGVLGAVARQQLDVLDRQIQLVAAGIMQFETVVRRASRLDGLQPDEAADAVIDMHHEIAGRQAGHFGDEIPRRASTRGAAAPGGRRECPAR